MAPSCFLYRSQRGLLYLGDADDPGGDVTDVVAYLVVEPGWLLALLLRSVELQHRVREYGQLATHQVSHLHTTQLSDNLFFSPTWRASSLMVWLSSFPNLMARAVQKNDKLEKNFDCVFIFLPFYSIL